MSSNTRGPRLRHLMAIMQLPGITLGCERDFNPFSTPGGVDVD